MSTTTVRRPQLVTYPSTDAARVAATLAGWARCWDRRSVSPVWSDQHETHPRRWVLIDGGLTSTGRAEFHEVTS